MIFQSENKSVDDMLQLKTNNMLYPNPEYQRGAVWTSAQKKRLKVLALPQISANHDALGIAMRTTFEWACAISLVMTSP
jgi:hypothetical protein